MFRAGNPSTLAVRLTLLASLGLLACTPTTDVVADAGPKTCQGALDCPSGQACLQGVCAVLPCGGRCDLDEICLNESCTPADGADCSGNSSLCPNGFVCSGEGQCRRECLTNGDCTAPGFGSCNPELGVCGECTFDSECSGNKPVCDTRSSRCVGCVDNADCLVNGLPSGKTCDTGAQICTDGCLTNNDCASGMRCEGASATAAGRCVQCSPGSEANDCAPHAPDVRCNPTTRMCVECLQNSDCITGQCNTINNTCVECVENQACAKGYTCDLDDNTCYPGCAGGAGGPNCPDTNPRLPVCDPARGERGLCVECLKDADCPRTKVCQLAGAGGLPQCVEGCKTNLTGAPNDARCAPTPGASSPEIDTKCDGSKGSYGRCVACLNDAQCASSQRCDVDRGVCRCKALGEACAATSECGFRDFGTSTTCDQGSSYRPLCITQVSCGGTPKNVTPVCTQAGFGLPDRGDSTGCPAGYVNERAKDANGTSFTVQCVPSSSAYKCP